jgi:hypothetical protein
MQRSHINQRRDSAALFPPLCRGRVRVGVETTREYSRNFYPHPSLPPAKGKELKLAALRRLTVVSAPLRGSPYKPPALPEVI